MPGLKWHECPRCKFWIDCETAPTYHTRIPEIAERHALTEGYGGSNNYDPEFQGGPPLESFPGELISKDIDISSIKIEKSFENNSEIPTEGQTSPTTSDSVEGFHQHITKIKAPNVGPTISAGNEGHELTDEDTMHPVYDKTEYAAFKNTIKTEIDDSSKESEENKKSIRQTRTRKPKKTWKCQDCKETFRTKIRFDEHASTFPNSSCKKREQTCYICATMCQHRTEYRHHLKTHDNDLEFKCLKCSSVFEVARDLHEHIEQSHEVPQGFHCNEAQCGKSFQTRYQLWMHNKRFHASDDLYHVCSWCGKRYKFMHSLRVHVKSAHQGTKLSWKPFECQNCAKRFVTKKEFKRHMADFGNQKICERQSVECCVCGFTFWNKETLRKHYKTHSHLKVFECRRCDAKFPLLARLRDHTLRHLGIRNQQCPLCGKMFKSKNEVNSHMNGVHSKERKFSCSQCGKAYKTRDCLNTHRKFVHETRTKNHKCELCPNVAFQYRATLIKHMKKHKMEHPFKCRLCPYQSHYRKSYETHFERDHQGQLPYMCVECSAGFMLESNLRDHLIGVHGHTDITQDFHTCAVCNCSFVFKTQLEIHLRKHQNMTHKCSFCLKEFKDRHLAETHMALVHKAGEKFEHLNSKFVTCEKCGKSFPHRAKLERHALSHSNLRPFKCLEPGCTSAFKDESTLKNHMKRLHLGGLEKPCKCDICGKCFVHNNKLREHIRVHSGEKPYHCTVCNFSCAIKGNLTKHMKVHK